MSLHRAVFFLLAMAILLPVSSAQGESDCRELSPDSKGVVDEILSTETAYDCCDGSIASCLQQTPPCPLARRLENEVCRMARRGFSTEQIKTALASRKRIMDRSAPKADILLDDRFMAGDPKSPVVLVMYACGRSPLCSTFVQTLYHEVTSGNLKGKVKLYFRPVYLDGPLHAEKCCRSLVAAADQAMFWPYVLYLYYNQEQFQSCLLDKWAEMKGLDQGAFRLALESDSTLNYVKASMDEARVNNVETLPGIFINGRRYVYDISTESLLNVLEEEWEFLSRKLP